jgi:hypothetical protein
MRRYQITNYFDVWGHGPSECTQYNCPCVTVDGDDEDGSFLHNEDRCDCHYEVNNWCSEGILEVEEAVGDDEDNGDAAVLTAMIARGLIREGVTTDMVEFEWPGPGAVLLNDAKTGCPLFALMELEDERKEG